MRIIIERVTEEAMDILGLKQYPFTSKDLKNCFRSSAFLCHKDTGGSDEKMRRVLESFKVLQHLPIDAVEVGITPIEEVEADMFDLFEDKECFTCGGKGTKEIYDDLAIHSCLKCKGSGRAKLKCKFCKEGKFALRNGRIVDCKACNGTGIFAPVCNLCDGIGHRREGGFGWGFRDSIRYGEPKYKKVKCEPCNGKGTIRTKLNTFNPVIPKGAIL